MAKIEKGSNTKDGVSWDYTLMDRPAGGIGSGKQYDQYTGEWSTPECVSNDNCWAFFTAKYCIGCYSTCNRQYDDGLAELKCDECDACNNCNMTQSYGKESYKEGCTSAYGQCNTCDACQLVQGCGGCVNLDIAENSQSSLIKNVDESVTRRARGEGYSKAAANMIGAQQGADAAAENFNNLAMQQQQAANTTQADWLSKQGYLDALDQEIKNKKASQGLQSVGAALGGFTF